MTNQIRTRIAPSPTGLLHIGTARTALFNYIFAKQNQGQFILRIEDTDLERSKPEYEKNIMESLEWLGLKCDEFYKQSERLDIYEKYIRKLLDEDKAYYCFCTEEELEAQKEYQISVGQALNYSGKCRGLSKKEVEKKLKEKKPFVIRFKVPETAKKIVFDDLIRGKIEFISKLIGDFIISKGLKKPFYNFAAAIDDSEMEISNVIRGEDHISNTPKQILIQQALGFSHPKYAHLPLILGPDRSKLSKRHGASSITEYQEKGYLKETLINFMAFLGWNPGTEREIYVLPSLIKEFSLEKIQKGGAIFNIKRLDYLNGFYIRQKSNKRLAELCIPYLIKAGLIEQWVSTIENCSPKENSSQKFELFKEKKPEFKIKETGEIIGCDYLIKVVKAYHERLRYLSEIAEFTDFFFKKRLEYNKDLLKWKDMTDKEVNDTLDKLEKILSKIESKDFNKENLEKILMFEAGKAGDRGKLLWPLRVALTGKKASAGPFEVADILGKEKSIKRIKEARELFSKN
ncbi:glutamate--tRNA ligase [Candidatus Parcubacteria bacterium]|nr:glutamate--tRNA ligase [Candidatus Parcubacteria bacterium]